jgi:ribosomal protein S1
MKAILTTPVGLLALMAAIEAAEKNPLIDKKALAAFKKKVEGLVLETEMSEEDIKIANFLSPDALSVDEDEEDVQEELKEEEETEEEEEEAVKTEEEKKQQAPTPATKFKTFTGTRVNP